MSIKEWNILFFIKYNGTSHTFKSKLSEKIKTIKNKVKEKLKIHYICNNYLILNYWGKFLNDNLELIDYGVQNGSTIEVFN